MCNWFSALLIRTGYWKTVWLSTPGLTLGLLRTIQWLPNKNYFNPITLLNSRSRKRSENTLFKGKMKVSLYGERCMLIFNPIRHQSLCICIFFSSSGYSICVCCIHAYEYIWKCIYLDMWLCMPVSSILFLKYIMKIKYCI